MEEQMQQITVESERVAREHAEQAAAIAAERDAEAEVLARVIEIVRPALRAVCDRICGDKTKPRLLIVADHEQIDAYGRHGQVLDDSPRYGSYLCLDATGALVRVEIDGVSSRWAGRSHCRFTRAAITARGAMDEYKLGECVRRILDALRRDQRAEATKASRERTAKLAAILALL